MTDVSNAATMSGPVQLAYAVEDVRAAAARWASLGAGPFFVLEHITLASARVNGEPAVFDHSSAFGWWGELMLELICQHDAPAQSSPRIVGTSGLHHVAHFVDDLDVAACDLVVAGHGEVLRAETAGGTRFAFHDGGAERGHLIEIYEPVPDLRRFYDMVRAASIDWEGSDPIRLL